MERAQLLKEARLKKRLTREQAAERLGVDPTTVKRWENGTSTPQPINLYSITEVYGLTLQQLGLSEFPSTEETPVATQNATTFEDEEEEDAITSFRKQDITSRLTHLVWNWQLSRHHARYQELQTLIALELEGYSRMHPDNINRRNALLAIDLCALSAYQPVIKRPIEEILTYCASGIVACWYLRKGKELAFADDAISKYIPTLKEIMKTAPPAQQKIAADLLAQCFLLASFFANHLSSRNNVSLYYAQQAEYYSEEMQNPGMQIVALRAQANAYDFANDWESALKVTQKAKYLLEERDRQDKQKSASSQLAKEPLPPLLESYVYAGLADYQSHTGQQQEVLTSLKKAHVAFFAQSSHDPPPIWVTHIHSEASVLLHDGLAHYHLGLYKEACDTFGKIGALQETSETTRVEALITQVMAELQREDKPRDMDRCIHHWEQAIQKATTIQSEQWFNASVAAHTAMRAAWPGEERIKNLRDQIKHW